MENAESQTQNTCFMAIELSKASWVIGMVTPLSDKVSLRKIPCGDVQRLMEIVDSILDNASRTMGRPLRIVSCYEAGYDGFWLHRVQARGISNHVLDAASLLVTRKARRAKTGRLDAEKLLRTLMAHWRGEPRVCSVARPPSAAEEDAKRLHRERAFLMKERVQHIGRIKGLLATEPPGFAKPPRPSNHTRRAAAREETEGRARSPVPEASDKTRRLQPRSARAARHCSGLLEVFYLMSYKIS